MKLKNHKLWQEKALHDAPKPRHTFRFQVDYGFVITITCSQENKEWLQNDGWRYHWEEDFEWKVGESWWYILV